MMKRTLPETASVAQASDGRKMTAPAAERNAEAICALLVDVAPSAGHALELASGTGQHVVRFSAALPDLHWQPSEIDAERRNSIDAYAAETGATNISPAVALDATRPGWGTEHTGQSLIVVINLLHLISTPQVATLIQEAARALAPGGRFVIYGPFMRAGELTSDGDRTFHASLIAHDPQIGYKDDFDTLDLLVGAGLDIAEVVEMPANNLAIIAARPEI